jgi:DNA polymerase I-like protein with 3'-5' exonuclease and polymerase domains
MKKRGISQSEYQLPLITPNSDWVMPQSLPDLRDRKIVAIDTEERDDGLGAGTGPGWATGKGYMLGLSWAAAGSAGYAPINHPDSECFDKEQVAQWMRDHVKAGVRFVFQNAPYDVGWMFTDLGVDIRPEHPIEDVLCAAFMLNENEYTYNLDDICARLGIPGKDETEMMAAATAYLRPAQASKGWKLTRRDLKANMWKLPARYVGKYATVDAVQTLEAFQILEPQLYEQGVDRAYRLEMDLVPVTRIMKARGIKIDVEYAMQVQTRFEKKLEATMAELRRNLPGRGLKDIGQLRSSKWLDPIMSDEGIRVPRTDATAKHSDGQSSYKQDWMEIHPHWLPKLVAKALQYDRFINTFIGEYVLNFMHKGRIHAEAHQYKSSDGGTVSYRYAYSNPPLQQAPSADMDPEFGVPFRRCFVAEGRWGANDYSQQEYRLTAHFAAVCKVRGGAEAARQFVDDPDLDFHEMVAGLTGFTRAKAKIQNFALLYGQGIDATAAGLGVSVEEAKEVRAQVEKKAPFGPALDEYARGRAQNKGFLKLLDGARVRFDEWEGGWIDKSEWQRAKDQHLPMEPCTLEEARKRKANPNHPWSKTTLRRSGVRKALNRLIQGSAARQTKMAIRVCAREKLYPILQMHDELDHDEDSDAKINRVSEIMRTVVELRVPMKVDAGIAGNWAEAKMKPKDAPKWLPHM